MYVHVDVTADIVPMINDNLFETNILRSYLHDNSISVSDMVKELITKFENKEYHPPTSKMLFITVNVAHIRIRADILHQVTGVGVHILYYSL